jgi:hypothetical protein
MHLLIFPFVLAGLAARIKINKTKKKNLNSIPELNSSNDIFFNTHFGQALDSLEITHVSRENIPQERQLVSQD